MRQPGGKPLVPVDFVWKELPPDVFVTIDYQDRSVLLNSTYRSEVLQGRPASKADAPLIKLLLMFLLHDHIDRKASSEKFRDWLAIVNHALVEACKKA